MSQLDRIEAMTAALLRRQTPPEGLARLWTDFPWLRPSAPPAEPEGLAAWLCTGLEADL